MSKIKQSEAADILATALDQALQAHPAVTWFVPGGSNTPITVEALKKIPDKQKQKLIVAQTDERYVPFDHGDANWRQLQDAGMIVDNIYTAPILSKNNKPLEDVTKEYGQVLSKLLAASYKIGQFGIGADGHIAGIKPNTQACIATGLVTGYQADDFTRITITFSAIKQLHEAYAFVFGENKFKTLDSLVNQKYSLSRQPAQILKSVYKSFIYNDQVGEKV